LRPEKTGGYETYCYIFPVRQSKDESFRFVILSNNDKTENKPFIVIFFRKKHIQSGEKTLVSEKNSIYGRAR